MTLAMGQLRGAWPIALPPLLGVRSVSRKLMNLMMENNGMSDIVERLRAKELLSIEEDGYTHFLPKNPDGDDGAAEIERLRAENEKLREALRPFAHNYQNNGLSHSMFMFEMKDLLAAKKALGDTDE